MNLISQLIDLIEKKDDLMEIRSLLISRLFFGLIEPEGEVRIPGISMRTSGKYTCKIIVVRS